MVKLCVQQKTTYLDKRCKWLNVSVGTAGLLAPLVSVVRIYLSKAGQRPSRPQGRDALHQLSCGYRFV